LDEKATSVRDALIRTVHSCDLTVRQQARHLPWEAVDRDPCGSLPENGRQDRRHLPGWPGARILLLDHTGAKSRIKRTSPLKCHEEGDSVSVVASKAGQPTHPAWFHNLKANPDTTIQTGPVVRRVRARVASDEERSLLWQKFVAFYPGYEFFQRNAKDRKIPIVILDPYD
jgi:deazaflavin-dependent oxidoreductase (nitroreductase family)